MKQIFETEEGFKTQERMYYDFITSIDMTKEVEQCWECGRDNWQHYLFEISFKHKKKSIWLCIKCYSELYIKNIKTEK